MDLVQIFTEEREHEEDVGGGEEDPGHPVHLLDQPGVDRPPTPVLEGRELVFEHQLLQGLNEVIL